MPTRRSPIRRVAAVSVLVVTALAACAAPPSPPPTTPIPTTPTPTYPPVPAPAAPLGKLSGLPWDSGLFAHSAEDTKAFEGYRGRKVDVIGVAPTRDSWNKVLNPWWLSHSAIPKDYAGTLNVAVPLFPNNGSMADAANGRDNANWVKLGRLIAKEYPTAYVRPGWEMNIKNWPWAAHPGNVEEYKKAFRNAARSLKKGGPKLQIVFNPNEGKGNSLPDAREAYPGDDVVDIIAIDAYDWFPAYDEDSWGTRQGTFGGWDFWGTFAREHAKRFGVAEWGVYAGSPESGGDNPVYMEKVMGWMRDNADIMSFDTYFDETAEYCRCSLSQNPKASQAYLEQLATWSH